MADVEHLAPEELRNADQISVDRLEIALVLPMLIQAKKRKDGSFVDPHLDPAKHDDFLNRWVEQIKKAKHPAGERTGWREVRGGYPPLDGEDAEPAYSEFCYFHPFVRNFLYVTRGDIRAWDKVQEQKFKREGRKPPAGVNTPKALIENSPNRNLRILERQGLKELHIEYEMDVDGRKHYQLLKSVFSITSCWLYLFDTQIAMLGLRLLHLRTEEVTATKTPASGDAAPESAGKFNLRKVLKIQDVIRRLYSPYWDTFPPGGDAGQVQHHDSHVPHRMTLVFDTLDSEGAARSVSSSFGNFKTDQSTVERVKRADFSGIPQTCEGAAAAERHLRNVFCNREPYTVKVWRELLWPLLPTLREPGEAAGFPLCFEHIQDDRAMLMSHIAVGDPAAWNSLTKAQQETTPRDVRRIKTGDWLRLANVDDPGDSDRYPYSPSFFEDPENALAGLAYDRFWHPTGNAPGQDDWHATRWLCSGYGFVGVGDAADEFFFKDGHSGALCHFRHHYFALAMIAQFHRSSLLNYKHRLAEAADTMLTDTETSERLRQIDFREGAESLAKEMMRFRTLYWFIEVSNQVQGRELFDMFRRHLNLQALFDDVYGDAEAAVGLLRQWDAEDEARASQSLAVLGAIFLILGPLISYLDDFPNRTKLCAYGSAAVILAGLVMLFVRIPSAWLVLQTPWTVKYFNRFCRFVVRRPVDIKKILCGVLIAAGAAGFALTWRTAPPHSEAVSAPAAAPQPPAPEPVDKRADAVGNGP